MSAENKVAVSVVMPAYDAEATLIQSLLSVQHQTMSDWELLVVDDGSTDRTQQIADHFSKSDSRIKYVAPAGARSPGHARQRGVALAKGEFVAFLDADDIWLPKKLEETISDMRGSGSVWTHTQYRAILKSGNIGKKVNLRATQLVNSVLAYNPIALSTVVVRRLTVPDHIEFYSRVDEDRQLWMQLMRLGHRPAYLDSATTLYRLSAKSLSSKKLTMAATRFRNLKFETQTEMGRILSFLVYSFRAGQKNLLRRIPCRRCEAEKSFLKTLEQKTTVIQAKLEL